MCPSCGSTTRCFPVRALFTLLFGIKLFSNMHSAYNALFVYNLAVIKEAKRWAKHNFIAAEQFTKISEEYKTPLYHPNLIIRILLFVATLFALSGISGILGLMFAQTGETFIYSGCIVYGIGSFFALEKMFIANNHFKS